MRILIDNLGEVGVVKDLPASRLPINGWSDANFVRFTRAGIESMSGDSEVFSPAASQPIWCGQFPPTGNPIWLYATAETSAGAKDGKVWATGASLNPHVDVTRLTAYETVKNERPMGFVHQGLGYFNNVKDVPQLWAPMTTSTKMVDLTNWSTNPEGSGLRVKMLRPHKNFLIAGYLLSGGNTYPYRLRWSDAAEPGTVPSTWDPTDVSAEAGERDLAETDDYVVDGRTLGEIFVVYKERSAWGWQFQGTRSVRTWKLLPQIGVLARDCIAEVPQGHLVLTQDDVVFHSGTAGSVQPVLRDRLRKYLFRTIDASYYYNAFLTVSAVTKEVWICWPRGGSEYANQAILWNWETNDAALRELPSGGVPFMAAGVVGFFQDELATWG